MSKILIIDDDRSIVNLIQRLLADEGYDVVSAYDGEKGLKLVASERPDLVVLDINMPRMSGMAFYRAMIQENKDRHIPVLVMTGRNELEGFFKDIQIDGFIAKPFRIQDFAAKIQEILKKNSHQSSADSAVPNVPEIDPGPSSE